jgi:hypothetical protein
LIACKDEPQLQHSDFIAVDTPIAAMSVSQEFTVRFHEVYVVQVVAERNLSFEQLPCMMGIKNGDADECGAIPTVLDAKWRLWGDGSLVAEGSSKDSRNFAASENVVYREIGRFSGTPGKKMKIDVEFSPKITGLDPTNPRLRVEVPVEIRKKYTRISLP